MRVDRQIRFEYAACRRGNFLIRREKVTDSKLSGCVRTGPSFSKICEAAFIWPKREKKRTWLEEVLA